MTAPVSPTRPRWQHLLGDLLRDLTDPSTYKMGLYLLLTFPLGLIYFIVLLTGFSTGASLLVIAVGVPILVLTMLMALAFAKLERTLAQKLLNLHLPHDSTVEQLRRNGWWRWLSKTMAELSTWKALLFLTLKLPLGGVALVALLGFGGASVGLLFAPLLALSQPDAVSVLGDRQLTSVGWAMLPLAGLGGLIFTASTVQALGKMNRWLVGTLLYDSEETRRSRRQIQALSRSASIVAYAGTLSDTINPLLDEANAATGAVGCMFSAFPERPQAPPELCAYRGISQQWATQLMTEYVQRPQYYAQVCSGLLVQRNVQPTQAPASTICSLPVIYRGEWFGRLDFFFIGPEPKQSHEFLGAIADQAAVAVQNSRLFSQLQQQTSKEERQRLARELHDSVAQALYGITLSLETALTWLERDPAKARKPIEYAFQLSKGGTAEMRALLFALRPESLEQEGLVAALSKQATVLSARYHLNVHTNLCAEPALPLSTKEALYRIAQEALHNVIKHAEATEVHLNLLQQQNNLLLEIVDNGKGFDPQQTFVGHLGLQSMGERAEGIGAIIHLNAQPGKGVHLQINVPVHLISPSLMTEVTA